MERYFVGLDVSKDETAVCVRDDRGEGDLDVAGCLKVLRKLKYKRVVALEYEENPKNPLSDLAVCLKSVRAAVKSLG